MMRKGGIQPATRRDWSREWSRNTPKQETGKKKKAGSEGEFFPMPDEGLGMLMWDDAEVAGYIKEKALGIKDMVSRRESLSMSRLATGQLFGLLERMKVRRCFVGQASYSEALRCLSWGGNTKPVFRLLELMDNASVKRSSEIYQHLINALGRDHSPDDGMLYNTLKQLQKEGVEKTPGVYLAVMRYFSNKGDYAKAKQIWEAMTERYTCGSHAWGLLIGCSPNFDVAAGHLMEMYSSGERVKEYHVQGVLRSAAREGNVEKSEKFFERLASGEWVGWLGCDGDPPLPVRITQQIIHCHLLVYSKSGLVSALKQKVKILDTHSMRPDNITYAILLEANLHRALSHPSSHTSLASYTGMLIAQALNDGIQSCRRIYTIAMRFYSITGDVAAARSLRNTATDYGVTESEEYLRYLADVFEKAGVEPGPGELEKRAPHVKSTFANVSFSNKKS
eukprot:TRINITY_DN14273_c0_g1_i1.p1 TRINITY_DN14273_c0_g1~~TRINITY_DN14273_c0_g1_i1.p1  ORF type:complete len:450 (+),score=94.00 TRINITY_DN14273_c0_g1_i1:397-1746(+)